MKINVVGTSASGKSTFGRQLAKKLDVPFIEMDELFWKADWQEPADAEFFPKLETALNRKTWVLDGNYTRTIPIKWKSVDLVIWLDYSFSRTLYQSVTRALNRSYAKKELWPNTGNQESFRKLFSRDSIVLWMIKGYSKNRTKYIKAMADSDYSEIEFIHLTSPKQAIKYLESLP